ncbi:MAG: VOC family protein [Streptococcus hyovaginalis]|nr:VOC family protein [Streptococcus hyovaginalis]
MEVIKHIHHISAIIGNVHENLQFYREILQLRLVKQTVNFDDSTGYHLYFANQAVDPGTLMTFFPWENAEPGQKGSGQGGRIAFRVPKGLLGYWRERLTAYDVSYQEAKWFEYPALFFQDHHALNLALVEGEEVSETPDLLGFHGVELLSSHPSGSVAFLKQHMGLVELEESSEAYRLQTTGHQKHDIVIPKASLERGSWGLGTVHHIAWHVSDETSLMSYSQGLSEAGFRPTVVRDRKYFKSIYLREAGHVIFEFATAKPGMTVDEPFDQLGMSLQLPKKYENRRALIEAALEPLNMKGE